MAFLQTGTCKTKDMNIKILSCADIYNQIPIHHIPLFNIEKTTEIFDLFLHLGNL